MSGALAAALAGCVGTDILDDPLETVAPRLVVTPSTAAIRTGDTLAFQASYYDSLGNLVGGVPAAWSSSDAAVTAIDAEGVVLGRSRGQAAITASINGVTSEPALLTVVGGADEVASVAVTAPARELQVGGTLQLTAVARNVDGAVLDAAEFLWQSSNPAVAAVSAAGLVTGESPGEASITAASGGVSSLPTRITVFGPRRTGFFTGRPGSAHQVTGTATLGLEGEVLVLRFGGDFRSSSGPGLYVYLSRTSAVGSGSLELGPLAATAGAQSYRVPPGVALRDYDWVIVHCRPFNATFGFARFD